MTTVDPGIGYRLLKQGEPLQIGDEFLDEDTKEQWHHIAVPSHFGGEVGLGIYRRKIEPQQSGWIPINGQYSSIQFPCWVADDKGVAFRESITDTSWATHWWPLKFPSPPPPAEDPADNAFEKWSDALPYTPAARESFKAGAAWQKEQKQ